MNTTLFIEISEITARVLVYNEVDQLCHYIDVTGGYGKKSIPLHIHYLKDGEILIGEDAVGYDVGEDSKFIESVLYAKEIYLVDYIKVLMAKVEELVPDLNIKVVTIVSDLTIFKSQEFQLTFGKEVVDIVLELISIEEAMAGWYKYNKESVSEAQEESNQWLTTLYLDYKNINIYQLTSHSESQKIKVTNGKSKLDLNAIHEFYINLLSHLHEKDDFTMHQINQLYNSQKATIHKQLILNKDVNVYSSIFFPPRKLVLPYTTFSAFKEGWYEQLRKEGGISFSKHLDSVDKVIISGGYDLISFLDSFEGLNFKRHRYEEYLLLDGAYHFYNSRIKGEELIYKQELDYAIGVFNHKEFYPLIQENEAFMTCYELELMLSETQKEIQLFSKINDAIKPMVTITIEEPIKMQRILLKIKMNNDKEIEEVSYELRRL